LDKTSDGSIMSYKDRHYLTPVHELYLGLIEKDRVITPEKSSTIELDSTNQDGPALMRLPITNKALQQLLAKNLSPISKNYDLWIGNVDESEEEQKVGIMQPPGSESTIKMSTGLFTA